MRTRTINSYARKLEIQQEQAAKRRDRYQRETGRVRAGTLMDISTIGQWSSDEWAEFERRFAPPSWRTTTRDAI